MRQLCTISWQTLPVQWLVLSGLSSCAACSISVGTQWIWLWTGGSKGVRQEGEKGGGESEKKVAETRRKKLEKKLETWFITSSSFQHSTVIINSVIILYKYAKGLIRWTARMNSVWAGTNTWNSDSVYSRIFRKCEPLERTKFLKQHNQTILLNFSGDNWTEWKILLCHTLVTPPFSTPCLSFSNLVPSNRQLKQTQKIDKNVISFCNIFSAVCLFFSQNKVLHLHFLLKAKEDISWCYRTSWWLMDMKDNSDNMEIKHTGHLKKMWNLEACTELLY